MYDFGQIFIVVNGQILKNQFGHLVTLSGQDSITSKTLFTLYNTFFSLFNRFSGPIFGVPKKSIWCIFKTNFWAFYQILKTNESWGDAIAQWILLRLPSCRAGFESQAHHLCYNKKTNKTNLVLCHFIHLDIGSLEIFQLFSVTSPQPNAIGLHYLKQGISNINNNSSNNNISSSTTTTNSSNNMSSKCQ